MPEEQHHGFAFEDWVKKTFFDIHYTSEWDIPRELNPKPENGFIRKVSCPVEPRPEALRSIAGGDNHRVRQKKRFRPGGAAEELKHEFWIEIHVVTLKKVEILLSKSTGAMVFFLFFDITPYRCKLGYADCEGSISFLPGELSKPHFLMHPARRGRLDLPEKVRKAMGGF